MKEGGGLGGAVEEYRLLASEGRRGRIVLRREGVGREGMKL